MPDGLERRLDTLLISGALADWLEGCGIITIADLIARLDDLEGMRLYNIGARKTLQLFRAVIVALADGARDRVWHG